MYEYTYAYMYILVYTIMYNVARMIDVGPAGRIAKTGLPASGPALSYNCSLPKNFA